MRSGQKEAKPQNGELGHMMLEASVDFERGRGVETKKLKKKRTLGLDQGHSPKEVEEVSAKPCTSGGPAAWDAVSPPQENQN